MDFRRISHFVHVAEQGSLTKAAQRLHIVQPALSQSISRLEAELGTDLFTRSRTGMELTEAGKLFLKSAYGILNQLNRAKENISAIGDNPKGTVSIAMTASALNVLSLPLCRKLQQQYPGISINLEEGLAANIEQGFDAGHYDLVVSYLAKLDGSIHIENLIEEELFLVGAAQKEDGMPDVPFQNLAQYPLLLPQNEHGVRAEIEETAQRLGVEIQSRQISGALHPTLQLIEAGFGYSLLPWSAIYDRVDAGKLSAQSITSPKIKHSVSMMYPTHRPLTQATIAVMSLLRQAVLEVHAEGKWRGELLLPAE